MQLAMLFLQECGRVFGLFGEVAQLDLTRLRETGGDLAGTTHILETCWWHSMTRHPQPMSPGALRVCFFESKAALALQDYLDTHGSLWRCAVTVMHTAERECTAKKAEHCA